MIPVLQTPLNITKIEMLAKTFHFHRGAAWAAKRSRVLSVSVEDGCLRCSIAGLTFWERVAVVLNVSQEGFQSPPEKIHFPEGPDRHQLSKNELRCFHEVPSL